MEIQSIGVIGAGQMGNGIAHVMAVAGYDVVMTDISQEALDAAVARIGKNLGRQVSKGTLSAADQAAALARIRTTLETAEVAQTDLVIEAAMAKGVAAVETLVITYADLGTDCMMIGQYFTLGRWVEASLMLGVLVNSLLMQGVTAHFFGQGEDWAVARGKWVGGVEQTPFRCDARPQRSTQDCRHSTSQPRPATCHRRRRQLWRRRRGGCRWCWLRRRCCGWCCRRGR